MALAGPGPTVALVGDLAFLHDVSALVAAEGDGRADLTVVVADNGGGGIFSFLEPAAVLDAGLFDTLFGTPQGSDVAAVAAGFGWPVDDVGAESGPGGLERALARRMATGSRGVIRVRLPGPGRQRRPSTAGSTPPSCTPSTTTATPERGHGAQPGPDQPARSAGPLSRAGVVGRNVRAAGAVVRGSGSRRVSSWSPVPLWRVRSAWRWAPARSDRLP